MWSVLRQSIDMYALCNVMDPLETAALVSSARSFKIKKIQKRLSGPETIGCQRGTPYPSILGCRLMKVVGKLLIYFLACLMMENSYASTSTSKVWSSFTVNGTKGDTLYYVEPQVRLIDRNGDPFDMNQFLLNMGLGRSVSSQWQLWIGQTFATNSQDADPGDYEEYRLWQQAVWNNAYRNITMTSRSRLEERKSFDYSELSYRFRERLLTSFPLTHVISLELSDEIFFNLNHANWIATNTLDQNRAYIGFAQKISNTWSFGVGYMSQYLSTSPAQWDNVLVLNLRLNMSD